MPDQMKRFSFAETGIRLRLPPVGAGGPAQDVTGMGASELRVRGSEAAYASKGVREGRHTVAGVWGLG